MQVATVDFFEARHRCRSSNVTVQNVSVSDGGHAIVGYITHNAQDNSKADFYDALYVTCGKFGSSVRYRLRRIEFCDEISKIVPRMGTCTTQVIKYGRL